MVGAVGGWVVVCGTHHRSGAAGQKHEQKYRTLCCTACKRRKQEALFKRTGRDQNSHDVNEVASGVNVTRGLSKAHLQEWKGVKASSRNKMYFKYLNMDKYLL